MSVAIEIHKRLLLVISILSRTVLQLSQTAVHILDTLGFRNHFGGLGSTYSDCCSR